MSTIPDQTVDCIILGAGIGGLTAAWELARAGKRVVVIESKPNVSGVIGTHDADAFLLESGPNSFTSFPPDIMELIDQVGLGARVLAKSMRDHDRFVWRNGALRKVPWQALKPMEFARAIFGLFKKVSAPQGDCTIGEYFRPRLGDAMVDNMLKPFLAGVYAADADRVSFEATLTKIYEMVRPHERLIVPVWQRMRQTRDRGKRGTEKRGKSLVSFPTGLRELPEAMARAIESRGGILMLGAPPTLESKETGQWRVCVSGHGFVASRVILATEAWSAAALLSGLAPACAEILRAIPYAPLIVVHAGLRADQLGESRDGFGFLSVDGQGVRMLGMIWSEKLFENRAPAGHRLLTCFYGGEKDPEVMAWDEDALTVQLRKDLITAMKFAGGDFRLLKVTRWERALPVFRVNHLREVERLKRVLPAGISLLGNYLGEVSVPNRVVAAKRLVAEME